MRFRLLLVMGLVALGVPSRAEPRRSPATEKAARTQLATADRAFRQGDYDGALGHLQAAYAIDPRPEYLIVFAQVYRAMGDPQRAINACELYLSTAPQGPRANEARGLAAAARVELDKKKPAEPPPSTPPPTPPSQTSTPPERASVVPPPSAPELPPPLPAPLAPLPHRTRVGMWIGIGAATVVVGVALGLGLGLGLPRSGPPTISFDPPR